MCLDFSNICHIRIHKEQFDKIETKGKCILLDCAEDGRVIAFSRNTDLSPIPTEAKDDKGE